MIAAGAFDAAGAAIADLGLAAHAVAQCIAGPLEALSIGSDERRAELVALMCAQAYPNPGESGLDAGLDRVS